MEGVLDRWLLTATLFVVDHPTLLWGPPQDVICDESLIGAATGRSPTQRVEPVLGGLSVRNESVAVLASAAPERRLYFHTTQAAELWQVVQVAYIHQKCGPLKLLIS